MVGLIIPLILACTSIGPNWGYSAELGGLIIPPILAYTPNWTKLGVGAGLGSLITPPILAYRSGSDRIVAIGS